MSTVHFIGGEKGGVGKSVVARVLAQNFIDESVSFVGVDADLSHGALVRFYGEYTQPVDLEAFAGADQIMDRALGGERRVLVDLPAQSARALGRWMTAGDVAAFARDMAVELVYWHVTDGGYDSVGALERAVQELGDTVRFVIVRNHGRSDDFSQLDGSPVAVTLRELGATFVDLPRLEGPAMHQIDRMGLSFWAALHHTGEGALSPMERRRAQMWLTRCYAAVAPAFVQPTPVTVPSEAGIAAEL